MQKPNHKQAFLFALINYVGIAIGVVSTLFIYPKNKELLGVLRYVEALAQTIYPILLFGASQALINFNPKLDDNLKKKLFNYSVFSILGSSTIMLLALIILSFVPFFAGMKYIYFSFAIAFFFAFIELFKKQSAILQKIAIPTLFDNIIPKIALPIVFLLLLKNIITETQSLLYYSFSYGLIFVLSGFYLWMHLKPTIHFSYQNLFKIIKKSDYYKFSLFAFAGSLGSVFAFRIDALMIPKLIGMTENGTFSIGVTLASALAIPATGLFVLYAPIIANHIKNNDFIALNKDYKSTAKFLFFIGALLYSCIFLGIENLFLLLPTHKNLIDSVPIILILGGNVLINMGTGFNGEIITYSRFYNFNLKAILVLIILNVILNLFFIKIFHQGIVGVASASLISMVVFNAAKLIFIYKKMKLFPFDFSYLKLVAVFISTFLIVYFLPEIQSPFWNLIFKCGLNLVLNLTIIYRLKLVYQFHFQIDRLINKYLM